MSARGQFWVTTVLSVILGAAGWWALFIDHPQTLGGLAAVATLAMFPLGMLAGWKLCSWRSGGRADELERLRERVSEDAERIADLKAENKALEARLNAALGASGAGRERPTEQARDVDGHLAVCDAGLSLLDRDMARAALAILGGERVKVGGEWEGAIRRSIDRRDWFFQPGYGVFMGMVDRDSPTGTYIIRDVWRRYLSGVGPHRLLEARAGIGEGD